MVYEHLQIRREISTYNMSSNIRIEKSWEWRGNKFIAQSTVTRLCSKRCSEHSYKARLRKEKVQWCSVLSLKSTSLGLKKSENSPPHPAKWMFWNELLCLLASPDCASAIFYNWNGTISKCHPMAVTVCASAHRRQKHKPHFLSGGKHYPIAENQAVDSYSKDWAAPTPANHSKVS